MRDKVVETGEGEVYRALIIVAAFTFAVLPFFTTFNEFLTRVVESFKLVGLIQSSVAPFTVKAVAVVLGALGVPASGDGAFLYLTGGWMPLKIYINWNCVGWQSLVLLAFTLATGLQGPFTRGSRLLTVIIGLEGTFILNLVRILVPTLLAHAWGQVPAVVFHDYLGTVLTLLWMVAFWYYAFGNVLVRRDDAGQRGDVSSHGFIGGMEDSLRGSGGDD
jgi:exosortase/archaeosortase family protein